MATDVTIQRAGWGDVLYVAHSMRRADRVEALAAALMSPLDLLAKTYQLTPEPQVARIDGEPVAMFGVARQFMAYPEVGTSWLVGTDKLIRYRKQFVRQSLEIAPELFKQAKYLENYVDARNEFSLRYLRRLGFAIDEARPYGVLNRPFHRFYMETT